MVDILDLPSFKRKKNNICKPGVYMSLDLIVILCHFIMVRLSPKFSWIDFMRNEIVNKIYTTLSTWNDPECKHKILPKC